MDSSGCCLPSWTIHRLTISVAEVNRDFHRPTLWLSYHRGLDFFFFFFFFFLSFFFMSGIDREILRVDCFRGMNRTGDFMVDCFRGRSRTDDFIG